MLLPIIAVIGGLIILVWSADRFVDGSAGTANHLGVPPLLIGMIIVGFGTSAPEMVVSAMAAFDGNPGLALGNAYGSNIANIGLILGVTALLCPIAVHSSVVRKELPILLVVTGIAAWQLWDANLSRFDAIALLIAFCGLMGWTVYQGLNQRKDPLGEEIEHELDERPQRLGRDIMWIVIGLVLLVASSRVLVWGAVKIALTLGVSDLIIGLTIVAVGTSLPELAASIVAARKNEPDIALGNVIGSNLFNTLAVVGIAGVIHPLDVPPEILSRDLLAVAAFSLALFVFCFGFGNLGRVSRPKGGLLIVAYVGYTGWLLNDTLHLW